MSLMARLVWSVGSECCRKGHGSAAGIDRDAGQASFHRAEHPPVRSGRFKQHVHYLVANRGCQRRPSDQERAASPAGESRSSDVRVANCTAAAAGRPAGAKAFSAFSTAPEASKATASKARRFRRCGVGGRGNSAVQQRLQIHSRLSRMSSRHGGGLPQAASQRNATRGIARRDCCESRTGRSRSLRLSGCSL